MFKPSAHIAQTSDWCTVVIGIHRPAHPDTEVR